MHNHNHNPDATWETTLVIPEAIKSVEERTLDAVLRIEELLGMLLSAVQDKGPLEDPEPTMSQFVSKEDLEEAKTAKKGKRK